MAKSKKRQELQAQKETKIAARLAEYAPVDRRARRKANRERSRKWETRTRGANQGLQPTTKASHASWAHDLRRMREEERVKRPVTISYGCTCPRNCELHGERGAEGNRD